MLHFYQSLCMFHEWCLVSNSLAGRIPNQTDKFVPRGNNALL